MIAAAQAQTDASLGAMLPSVPSYLNGGLKGGATDPSDTYNAQASLAVNIEVTNVQTPVARAFDNQIEVLFRFNPSRINLARAKGQIVTIF